MTDQVINLTDQAEPILIQFDPEEALRVALAEALESTEGDGSSPWNLGARSITAAATNRRATNVARRLLANAQVVAVLAHLKLVVTPGPLQMDAIREYNNRLYGKSASTNLNLNATVEKREVTFRIERRELPPELALLTSSTTVLDVTPTSTDALPPPTPEEERA